MMLPVFTDQSNLALDWVCLFALVVAIGKCAVRIGSTYQFLHSSPVSEEAAFLALWTLKLYLACFFFIASFLFSGVWIMFLRAA